MSGIPIFEKYGAPIALSKRISISFPMVEKVPAIPTPLGVFYLITTTSP